MTHEIALFWLVATGFLVVDNLILLPQGADLLRVRRSGALDWEPGVRIEARGRELVLLNPLDCFQRVVVSTQLLGPIDPAKLRAAARELRAAARALAPFGWLGSLYLSVAIGLGVASFRYPFAWVLLVLLGVHLAAWSVACVLLVRRRRRLGLSGGQAASLAAEAFFVPAYTINLGKRVLARRRVDLPALSLAAHRTARLGDEGRREQRAHRLGERLAAVEQRLPDDAAASRRLLTETRACLKASAAST